MDIISEKLPDSTEHMGLVPKDRMESFGKVYGSFGKVNTLTALDGMRQGILFSNLDLKEDMRKAMQEAGVSHLEFEYERDGKVSEVAFDLGLIDESKRELPEDNENKYKVTMTVDGEEYNMNAAKNYPIVMEVLCKVGFDPDEVVALDGRVLSAYNEDDILYDMVSIVDNAPVPSGVKANVKGEGRELVKGVAKRNLTEFAITGAMWRAAIAEDVRELRKDDNYIRESAKLADRMCKMGGYDAAALAGLLRETEGNGGKVILDRTFRPADDSIWRRFGENARLDVASYRLRSFSLAMETLADCAAKSEKGVFWPEDHDVVKFHSKLDINPEEMKAVKTFASISNDRWLQEKLKRVNIPAGRKI